MEADAGALLSHNHRSQQGAARPSVAYDAQLSVLYEAAVNDSTEHERAGRKVHVYQGTLHALLTSVPSCVNLLALEKHTF